MLCAVDGRIAVITINRPEARNAVNGEVARGMAAALDEFEARNDVRVLVLTGAGGTFCAGMDLKGFLAGETRTPAGAGFAGITERPPPKPVIAAVEGYALAGGFEIVLACDLMVASEAAEFGLPEVPARPGRWRGRPAQAAPADPVPPGHGDRAVRRALPGGPAARRAGLVSPLVPAGQALAGARDLARRLGHGAPLALAASKRVIVESADWPAPRRFARQGEIAGRVFGSADAIEGAAAFAEKRAPVWRGE